MCHCYSFPILEIIWVKCPTSPFPLKGPKITRSKAEGLSNSIKAKEWAMRPS